MTNQEILEKAITKAIDGGWKPTKHEVYKWFVWEHGAATFMTTEGKDVTYQRMELLFDHDFAKALWGEEHDCDAGYHKRRKVMHVPEIKSVVSGQVIETAHDEELNLDSISYCLHGDVKNYKYHLQQMVIADDPIAYLGVHLDA